MVSNDNILAIKAEVRRKDIKPLNFVIKPDGDVPPSRHIPSVLSLVPYASPTAKTGERAYQLFLDEIPVPSKLFKYDPHDRVLSWSYLYGGGYLSFHSENSVASGTLGSMSDLLSIRGGSSTNYICDSAENVGATYIYEGMNQTGISWNPQCSEWKNAKWSESTLRLKYTIIDNGPMRPPSFSFEFEDLDFEITEQFDIDGGLSSGSVELGEKGELYGWNITFLNTLPEESFFIPSQLQAFENLMGDEVDGAFCIDEEHKGDLYGLKGKQPSPYICGYYRSAKHAAPFGIFDGKIKVDGKQPKRLKSFVKGNVLQWKGLSPTLQKKLGLPTSGVISFESDGSSALSLDHDLNVVRLDAEEAYDAIRASPSLYRTVGSLLGTETHRSLFSEDEYTLDISGLLTMTPFTKDDDGDWYDAVQQGALADLWEIINSYIPKKLWQKLFDSAPQPVLSGYLDNIANTPVTDEEGNQLDPEEYYKTLSTTVLCIKLKDSTSESAKLINSKRAETRFSEETSSSPVYQKHMQLLFQHHWAEKEQATPNYVKDQEENAASYTSRIDEETELQCWEIDEFIYEGPGETLKTDLKNHVKIAAEYAKSMKLYWAFHYYTYVTDPSMLSKYKIALSISQGNGDGTEITRLSQQHINVLTAMDSSNFFASEYVDTLNTFLGTSMLLSMLDYTNDELPPDMITAYLERFVELCLESDSDELTQAAADIQAVLDAENYEEMLDETLSTLRKLASGSFGLNSHPMLMKNLYKSIKEKTEFGAVTSKTFCKVLMMSMGGAQIFLIFMGWNSYGELGEWEKAQLITFTSQFVVQTVYQGMRKGIKFGEEFDAKGHTKTSRMATFSKMDDGGVKKFLKKVSSGIKKVGDSVSRYIADMYGKTATNVFRIPSNQIESTSKRVGKKLDKFVGPSLGALFEVAGIVFDIAGIVKGDTGLMLAADITGIVAGALTICSVVGKWFLKKGAEKLLLSTIVSIAGPLGTILSIISLGLAIASLFQNPPDPIEEFINDYVKPAGLDLTTKCGAVEYVETYSSVSRGYEVLGFTLSPQTTGKHLRAELDKPVGLGTNDNSPNYVMNVTSNSFGESVVFTAVGNEDDGYSDCVLLSVKNDDQICFTTVDPGSDADTRNTTRSQEVNWRWKFVVSGTVTMDDEHFSKANFVIELVGAKSKKYLGVSDGQVVMTTTRKPWTLNMEGMRPVGMEMQDLSFVAGTELGQYQVYSPKFTFAPSLKHSFSVTPSLPNFLKLDSANGEVGPTDQSPTAGTTTHTISATNKLGMGSAEFSVTVEKLE